MTKNLSEERQQEDTLSHQPFLRPVVKVGSIEKVVIFQTTKITTKSQSFHSLLSHVLYFSLKRVSARAARSRRVLLSAVSESSSSDRMKSASYDEKFYEFVAV